jgi:hypothetical protein
MVGFLMHDLLDVVASFFPLDFRPEPPASLGRIVLSPTGRVHLRLPTSSIIVVSPYPAFTYVVS